MSQTNRNSGGPSASSVIVLVAGVLLAGGGLGMTLNHLMPTTAGGRVVSNASGSEDAALPDPSPTPGVTAELVAAGSPAPVSFRVADVSVPENPFQPTQPDAVASAAPSRPRQSGGGGPSFRNVPVLPSAGGVAPVGAPRPAPAPETPAPKAEEVVLTGIVHGDPSVAVVRYAGQPAFLKPGETVADSWKLVEVRERSAVFQVGGRRVEVQIQGGN